MKKEVLIHFLFAFALLVFTALMKDWINWAFIPFFLGGILGTLLPDLDHLIYIYLLRPYEMTSQRVNWLIKEKNYQKAFEIVAETRYERSTQIFHTVQFQLIFLVLSFLVVTSSGSYFGTGIVLAFFLHLLVDQLVDFFEIGSLDIWFRKLPFKLDQEKSLFYWLILLLMLFFLAFWL